MILVGLAAWISLTEQSLDTVIAGSFGVLAALITAFGAWFVVLANKARKAAAHAAGSAALIAHEVQPNSGSSMKDQTNRTEAMVATLIKDIGDVKRDLVGVKDDIGGIRQENRDDRRATAEREQSTAAEIAELRGRVHGLEISKGTA